VVHSTAKNRLGKEVRHTLTRMLSVLPAERKKPANAIKDQTQQKHRTYGPLMSLMQQQLDRGRRSTIPTFIPMVATTHHELGPGFAQVQEWLVDVLKAKLEMEGPRDDGKSETDIASAFRFHFRLAMHFAIANGQALMQTTAGVPVPEAGARRRALQAVAQQKSMRETAPEQEERSDSDIAEDDDDSE